MHACKTNAKLVAIRPNSQSPWLSLTHLLVRRLNSFGSPLNWMAASTLAGLSSLGLLSMLMTERRMVDGVCTGDQRSDAAS
jgi:hypothetical protein